MIQLAKQMIDWQNFYFAGGDVMNSNATCDPGFEQGILGSVGFHRHVIGLHFYSQMVVIEKGRAVSPQPYMTGGYHVASGGPKSVWDGKKHESPATATAPIHLEEHEA